MISKAELDRLYNTDKLSLSQIAQRVGLSYATVQRTMRRFGLRTRDYALASANMNNQRIIKFNYEQEQLVLGSLLGDASLWHWTMRSNKKCGSTLTGYKLSFSHTQKQLDYLLHKKAIIGGCAVGQRRSGYGSIIKHFTFSHTPTLRLYAELCLGSDHKKHVSVRWLDKLDWLGIAYWYMDDGSLLVEKKYRRPTVTFHTESFTAAELSLLQEMLRDRFGLDTRRATANSDPRQQVLSSRHKNEVMTFLANMKEYIVPTMHYKIRCIL